MSETSSAGSPQLILFDRRRQTTKDYLVAVAASDGLQIRGVELAASPAKGETPLLKAGLKIPPLEDFDFNPKKIVDACFNNLVIGEEDAEQIIDSTKFIELSSEDEVVRTSLTNSISKVEKSIEKLIKEFTDSEVIQMIQQNRNDALFKLQNHAKDLAGKRVLCLDIEATDIATNPDADVIQVSICDLDGKEVLNQLINPGYEIPANEKHNITTEMVADAPFFSQAWEQIHQELKQADVILAYSTESDFAYLENSASKKMLEFELEYDKWLDVAELAKDLVGSMRWHSERMYWFWKTPKLTDAYEKILAKPFPGDAHDALYDAIATAELMRELLAKGKNSKVAEQKPEKKKPEPITNNLFAQAFANAKKR